MKRWIGTWFSLLFLAGGLAADAQSSGRARQPRRQPPPASASQLRGALQSVQTRIKHTRQQVRETRRKERRVTQEIAIVESRILATEKQIESTRSRLERLEAGRRVLTARIQATEERLAARRRALARRMRDSYQRGGTTYTHVLMQSRSLHDYLSRSYYVERLVASDADLIREIVADHKQLRHDRARLEAQLAETRQLESSYVRQKSAYRADVGTKRDLLQEIRETREGLEEALDELERASSAIEARIRAMQQTERGRARLARPWSGSFVQPAEGPVTSGFGMRHHPILNRARMHYGVDIGAPYGAPIRAAAAGEVIVSEYQRGYGYVIVIDHGGGVSTLYGHCSALLAEVGRSVSQGEVIARVGSTGLSTGPHLHFEVRRNGRPVNPQ